MENSMKLNDKQIERLSFPDSIRQNYEFDHSKSLMKIKLDSAVVNAPPPNRYETFGETLLIIDNWEALHALRYQPGGAEEVWESLREVCEFSYSPELCCICGFGVETGLWVEWRFQCPRVRAWVQTKE